MFKKPFKIKFQIQLKNSEKKKFGNDIKSIFPALRDEDISALTSNKENVMKMKVITFKEEDVDIYCVNKVPMYIDALDSNIKLPTVFLMWRFPHILPTFTSNTSVLNKLKNGADLFFPGIYVEGLFFCDMDFKKNDPVGMNLFDNKAVVAVGLSLVDKDDVLDRNKHKDLGKLVKIYHTVEDHLFKVQSDSIVLSLGPPDWALPVNEESQPDSGVSVGTNVDATEENNVNATTKALNQVQISNSGSSVIKADQENEESEQDAADKLLEYCLLKSLKTIHKGSYPILPATFYAKYILTSVPEGKSINLKKTKWKKFSIFLQEKSLEGLIKLQQLPKNEFTIAGVNTDHQQLKQFTDPYNVVSVVLEPRADNKPVVQQVYSVSAVTLPFFSKFGLKKHDELTRSDVRNHLNDFIKSENLADSNKPELVILDSLLQQILKSEQVISRGDLLSRMLDKMNVQHKVLNCRNGDAILHKGKMPLIEFETCLRTGNKKVTLISNLECYGVNVSNFSKDLQHKAAASTNIITAVPGKKGPQVQVQGNQIAVAVTILKDKYNMNEKFMKGLEKAVRSKTKK